MNPELIGLRIIHVVGAILWAGTSWFMAFFLGPALATVGPAAGPVMAAIQKRKLFTIVPIVAVLVMLAGLRLLQIASNGFSASYFATRSGTTYVTGAVCALLAFTVFMSVSHPSLAKMMKLGPQMAQAPEAERGALMAEMNVVRARAGKASLATAMLLTLAAIAMAVGRYV